MKTKLIVTTFLVASLTVGFFWCLHRNQLNQWLVMAAYVVALMVASFFTSRWISKQDDELKARYRVANVSMWLFLLLALAAAIPNFFINGQLDKAWFWPFVIISFSLLGTTFAQRHALLRELSEREKSGAN